MKKNPGHHAGGLSVKHHNDIGMSTINQLIGAKVKERRELWGLTQQELSDKAGLSKVTIGQIERGKATPSTDTIQKIVDALGCEIIFDLIEK